MHQKILEFPTLVSYSVQKLKRTGDPKLVDMCSDTISMHSLTVYLLNFRMGCRTAVNHFTGLHVMYVSSLGAPESSSLCIQPIWEHLGASGRICVAVQSC